MELLNYSFSPPSLFLHLSAASSVLTLLILSHHEFRLTPLLLAAKRPVKTLHQLCVRKCTGTCVTGRETASIS